MNEMTREIVRKIDKEVEEVTKGQANAKVAEAAAPFIKKYAAEAGIDEVDLFVDYMDHVALSSKHMAMNEEGEKMFDESEIDSANLKLY